MGAVTIRPAEARDVPRANAALAALAAELGDAHPTTEDQLAGALFGPRPVAHAFLAEAAGEAGLAGIAMASPLFSTKRGTAGLYVSDLWVAPGRRSGGLGRRLLAAVRDDGAARWGAGYLSLTAYADAPRSVAFYRRLGFGEATGTHHLTLEGAGLAALGDPE